MKKERKFVVKGFTPDQAIGFLIVTTFLGAIGMAALMEWIFPIIFLLIGGFLGMHIGFALLLTYVHLFKDHLEPEPEPKKEMTPEELELAVKKTICDTYDTGKLGKFAKAYYIMQMLDRIDNGYFPIKIWTIDEEGNVSIPGDYVKLEDIPTQFNRFAQFDRMDACNIYDWFIPDDEKLFNEKKFILEDKIMTTDEARDFLRKECAKGGWRYEI